MKKDTLNEINIMLYGEVGCGKSEIIKTIINLFSKYSTFSKIKNDEILFNHENYSYKIKFFESLKFEGKYIIEKKISVVFFVISGKKADNFFKTNKNDKFNNFLKKKFQNLQVIM